MTQRCVWHAPLARSLIYELLHGSQIAILQSPPYGASLRPKSPCTASPTRFPHMRGGTHTCDTGIEGRRLLVAKGSSCQCHRPPRPSGGPCLLGRPSQAAAGNNLGRSTPACPSQGAASGTFKRAYRANSETVTGIGRPLLARQVLALLKGPCSFVV